MKNFFCKVFVILLCGVVKAQESGVKSATFSKGNLWIEGGLSLTTGDSSNDYFAFSPKLGYFLSDKLAVGGDVDISTTSYLLNSNGLDDSNSYGFGGFVRYYFLELKNLKAYGEAGLGYNHTKLTYLDGATDMNNGVKANVDLGINYFFTPKWAATFTLAQVLSYNNSNPENGNSSNDLVVNVNLFNNIFAQPKFGLLYKW